MDEEEIGYDKGTMIMDIQMIVVVLLLSICKPALAQKSFEKERRKVFVIGAVHAPTRNLNADTILNLLTSIRPGLILIEADHHVFDNEYEFTKTYSGNEWEACLKYRALYPETKFRPFEIEGRNDLRKKAGVYSGAGFLYDQIFILDSLNKLQRSHGRIWKRSEMLSDSLAAIDEHPINKINSATTDKLVEERQFYQYKMILEITENEPFFSQKRIIGSNKDTLSLRDYFRRYSDFEQLRNEEMSDNILKWIKLTESPVVVVLVGYYHRFAIINRLKYEQEKLNFQLVNIRELRYKKW